MTCCDAKRNHNHDGRFDENFLFHSLQQQQLYNNKDSNKSQQKEQAYRKYIESDEFEAWHYSLVNRASQYQSDVPFRTVFNH